MKFTIITLYPDAIKPYLDTSILGRAQKKGLININIVNLRDFGLGKHKQVDDTPFGGGPGMILRADVVIPAIKKIKQHNPKAEMIMLTPDGEIYNQQIARNILKNNKDIILLAGRFEGFDARIDEYIDKKISVGPYVLAGGEIPALAIIESVARLIPEVLGNPLSPEEESHSENYIEYPQYTKPQTYLGVNVPEILISGDHKKIKEWREEHKRKL